MSSPDGLARTPVSAIAREWAWQQDVAPPARKLVLLAVCERLNHGTGIAWPGADDVAGRCGLERRVTHRHLAALIAAGLLIVVERRHGKGRPYPVYTVPPLVHLSAQSPQISEPLSAPQDTKLVHQGAQTFVHERAPEPLGNPTTVVQPRPVVLNQKQEPKGPAPLPPKSLKSVGNPRVQAFIDTLRAAGADDVEAGLTSRHKEYIALNVTKPEALAQCMADLAAGRWHKGDTWIMERFSVPMVHQHRFSAWLKRDMGGPDTNGPVKRGAAAVDQMLARRRQIPPPL